MWLATIEPAHADLKGLHTYGKTLPTLRRRVRDLLSLEVEDAGTAEIEFKFPKRHEAGKAIGAALAATVKAAKAEQIYQPAQAAQRDAAKALIHAGVAIRDAAEILGVSHQRVQQLTHA